MELIKSVKEINEEEYNILIALKNKDQAAFCVMIENIAYKSPFSPSGYGCELPMSAYKEDGKYFVSWYRWDSCD